MAEVSSPKQENWKAGALPNWKMPGHQKATLSSFEHTDRHKAQKLWSEPRRYREPSAHLYSWSMSHQKSQHSWQLTAVTLNLCFGGVYYKRQKRTDLDLMPPQPQISYRNLLKWLNPKGSFTCNQTCQSSTTMDAIEISHVQNILMLPSASRFLPPTWHSSSCKS